MSPALPRLVAAIAAIGVVITLTATMSVSNADMNRARQLTVDSVTALMNPSREDGLVTFDDAPLAASSFDLYATSWSAQLARAVGSPLPSAVRVERLRARVRRLLTQDQMATIFEQEELVRLARSIGMTVENGEKSFRRFAVEDGYATSPGGDASIAASVVALRNGVSAQGQSSTAVCSAVNGFSASSTRRASQDDVDQFALLVLRVDAHSSCALRAARLTDAMFVSVLKQTASPQATSALMTLRRVGEGLGIDLSRVPLRHFVRLRVGTQYSTSPGGAADPQMTFNVVVLSHLANAAEARSSLTAGSFREGWIGVHGHGDRLASYLGSKLIGRDTGVSDARPTRENVTSLADLYVLCASGDTGKMRREEADEVVTSAYQAVLDSPNWVPLAELAAVASACRINLDPLGKPDFHDITTAGDAFAAAIVGEYWKDPMLIARAQRTIRELTIDGRVRWTSEASEPDLLSMAIGRRVNAYRLPIGLRGEAAGAFSSCGVWALSASTSCAGVQSGVLPIVAASVLFDRESRVTSTDLLFAFAQ